MASSLIYLIVLIAAVAIVYAACRGFGVVIPPWLERIG
jgi:hypothetical protein